MRWLRLYDDTINDPKILKLPEAMRWHWIAMLCIASKNDGQLPPLDDVAIQLRVTTGKATEIIAALVKAGLLDKNETGFAPHNWDIRQYKTDVTDPTSASRSKRYRDRKRDASRRDDRDAKVSDERPETEAETEAEKKETREDALLIEFDAFWTIWPNKVGKPAALKAFRSARRRSSLDEIFHGAKSYIRDKPPDRQWLNPATFLNQNRWEDRPAQVGAANAKASPFDAAYDNILDRLNAGFGGPASEERLRSGEGETDARLLAYGGRQ